MAKSKDQDMSNETTEGEKAARERGYGDGFRAGARSMAAEAARELDRYSED